MPTRDPKPAPVDAESSAPGSLRTGPARSPRVPPPPAVGRARTANNAPQTNLPRRNKTVKVPDRKFGALDKANRAPPATHDVDEGRSKPTAPPAPRSRAHGPRRMPSLTDGPQLVRMGEHRESPTTVGSAHAHRPATGRTATPDAPPHARLPVPSMLRAGGSIAAKEFRADPKARGGPTPPATGVLPSGSVPPTAGAPASVSAADTGVLIAEVALELIGAPPPRAKAGATLAYDAPPARSNDHDHDHDHDHDEVAQSAPVGERSDARAVPPTPGPHPRRWAAAAALASVGVVWWALGGPQHPPLPTSVARVAARPSPGSARLPPATPATPSDLVAVAGSARTENSAVAAGPAPTVDAGGTANDLEIIFEGDSGTGGSDTGGSSSGASSTPHNSSDGGSTGEDPPGGDDPGANGPPPPATPPRKRRHKRGRRVPQPSAAPIAPVPKKAAKPAPTRNAPQLLADARRAYSARRSAQAFNLAKQSNALKASTGAVETMALASCQRKDERVARSMMKKLPRSRRGSVRDRCRTYGVRLGL